MNGVVILGVVASVPTATSYWPQVRKALPRGSTSDLSLKMLITLTSGLACWVAYGIAQHDWIIVI
jgi:MtN3 and saliva related transmembrane protein